MQDLTGTEVAIVGMAGRFPGAPDVETLWRRVVRGEDCLTDLDEATLRARGVDDAVLADPAYVRRAGVLDDVERFDAAFFGIGARDAALMDPQHRHFYECAWSALESAGHVPERFDGAIGVFAGCGMNTYLVNNLLTNPSLLEDVGWFLLRHTANDKDFLTTGVSYRLDLRGPSVNVQTACSTSLVALHLAVQSLLSLECDLALAGGVTIDVPHGVGYRYHEGEILSPDGRCRAFDADSGGTVLASGVGVVALRRYDDAVRDGDPILAVVRGSAVNNDGSRKVGYLAPSVDGHADVVREALAVAGLDARTVTLLEAHGTGTAVGDPIEFAALSEAFGPAGDDEPWCRLVSTKPNIGHLDTAAGVASVVKVVQAMRHGWLPPLANFDGPNPLLDLEGNVFTLSGKGERWDGVGGVRRAGVSSLGVGGTNAHVVLEAAPPVEAAPAGRAEQLLTLSARTPSALDALCRDLADHLESSVAAARQPSTVEAGLRLLEPVPDLADVAHTLAVGRRAFAHRRTVVATDLDDAVMRLRSPDRRRVADGVTGEQDVRQLFLFPGGGSQYAGMAAGLDDRFTAFHAQLERGVDAVQRLVGVDLGPHLRVDADPGALRDPVVSLCSVFVTELALAEQWMAWCGPPAAMVGHSLGEYAAAVLAGVLTFDDAISLVGTRARLMARVGEGAAMASVPLPERDLVGRLGSGLSLATVNAPDECVVSGDVDAIDRLEHDLAADGITIARVPLAAAAHSHLLDPVLDEFAAAVRAVDLRPPARPYLSNVTGRWITAAQATDPDYWVQHLRGTVRFAEGLAVALADGEAVTVELGPGQALSSYARRQDPRPLAAIPALRHPEDRSDDTVHLLGAVGRAWAHGVDLDRSAPIASGPRRRLRLPTYPFEGHRHWIAPGRLVAAGIDGSTVSAGARATEPVIPRRLDPSAWISTVRWDDAGPAPSATTEGAWVVIGDRDDPRVDAVCAALVANGATAATSPRDPTDTTLDGLEETYRNVVVLGPPSPTPLRVDGPDDPAALDAAATAARRRWLGDAAAAACHLGTLEGPTRLVLVTEGATAPDGGVAPRPFDAFAWGVGLVAPREHPSLSALVVDVPTAAGERAAAGALVAEILGGRVGVVALRGDRRLVAARQPGPSTPTAPVEASTPARGRDGGVDRDPWPLGGTVVVTGGLGGVGSAIASWLLKERRAHVVLVSSRDLPTGTDRDRYLGTHTAAHPLARRLHQLAALEAQAAASGASVSVVVADASDPRSLRDALASAAAAGPVHAVLHAAGQLTDRPLELLDDGEVAAVVGAKAVGGAAVVAAARELGIPLVALLGSTSVHLAPEGQAAYVAANATLAALAGDHGPTRVVTVESGVWSGTGMAAAAAARLRLGDGDEVVDHPLLTRRRRRRDGGVELFGEIAAADWVVAEHRLADLGTPILPGTGHLALHLAAAAAADAPSGPASPVRVAATTPVALRDLVLTAPLAVPEGATVAVRLTVDPPSSSPRRVQLATDEGHGRDWLVLSESVVDQPDPRPAPVTAIVPDPTSEGAEAVLARPRRRLALGPRWRAQVAVVATDDEPAGRGEGGAGRSESSRPRAALTALGARGSRTATTRRVATRVRLDDRFAQEPVAWLAHPALVDVLTAVAVGLTSDREGALAVPIGYERITAWDALPATVLVDIAVVERADGARTDLVVADDSGRVVATIEGLELRGVAGPLPVDTAVPPPPDGVDGTSTLLAIGERLGIRPDDGPAAIERALRTGGSRVVVSSVDLDELVAFEAARVAAAERDAAAAEAPAPSAALRDRMQAWWRDLLGVDVGLDEDFFDAGGHSLIAIRLMARVHRETGVRLPIGVLFEAPTVRTLAALVATEQGEPPPAATGDEGDLRAGDRRATDTTLAVTTADTAAGGAQDPAALEAIVIRMKRGGEARPLFLVHGAGGNVLYFTGFVRALPADRPVYAFQAEGADGLRPPDTSVEMMAMRYLNGLRREQPRGPYLLGGYSGGGIVALEMARRLHAEGEQIALVVLFDSLLPGDIIPTRSTRYTNLARSLATDPKSVQPWLRVWFKRQRRRLGLHRDGEEEHLVHQLFEDYDNQGFVNLESHFTELVGRYHRGRYPCDVLLVQADAEVPIRKPFYGWSEHIGGRLQRLVTPGTHHTMFLPGHVEVMAAAVAERLRDTDDRP